jgi:hypothetical protein
MESADAMFCYLESDPQLSSSQPRLEFPLRINPLALFWLIY